jgi:hypothetical protein
MEHKPDWLELAIQVEDVALRSSPSATPTGR